MVAVAAASVSAGAGETATGEAAHVGASTATTELRHDGHALVLEGLLLLLVLVLVGRGVRLDPLEGLVDGGVDGGLEGVRG